MRFRWVYGHLIVSTHSRPKAAGDFGRLRVWRFRGFNTQPPEGGWHSSLLFSLVDNMFQHTAARRRLGDFIRSSIAFSRSFNTQPPEGGWQFRHEADNRFFLVSTHSRPKAAGPFLPTYQKRFLFQHTAARRRLEQQHRLQPRQ